MVRKTSLVLVYLDNCLVSELTRHGYHYAAVKQFWDKITSTRTHYRAVISDYVLQESRAGSKERWVAERNALYKKVKKRLPASTACATLAFELRKKLKWSDDRTFDALHIAAASVYKIPYLVTIEKEMLRQADAVDFVLRSWGESSPLTTSPSEFMGRATNPYHGKLPRVSAGVREVREIRRGLIKRAGGDIKKLVKILATYGT